jgi:hypothetical protein
MMGENVVLGWLTLELTNSPFMVGAALGMRALPMFFVGVPAGALADQFPRHTLLLLTGIGQAITATALGLSVLSGTVTMAQVMLLTLAAGCLRGVEHAARQSYTHDVVGARALVHGLAILGVALRAGWLVGSIAIGSVIAHFGSGVAYLVVALGFLGGGLVLLPSAVRRSVPSRRDAMSRGSVDPVAIAATRSSVWKGTLEFLVTVRRDRIVLVLMVLTAGAEVLGFAHQVLLPSLARDVLHTGPEGLGVLSAARAVGGILGLAVASGRGAAGGAGFLGVLATFGASLVALGGAPHVVGFWGVVLVVTLVNACGALADLLAQSLLQLSVPDSQRGRAGGAWVVAIGLAPLGQMQIGALASLFGVSAALGTSGLALVLLAAATALLMPSLKRL